jgi:hypothetical protein
MPERPPKSSALRQGLWFVGLWAAGVGTVTVIGGVLKFWLR